MGEGGEINGLAFVVLIVWQIAPHALIRIGLDCEYFVCFASYDLRISINIMGDSEYYIDIRDRRPGKA